VRVPAGIRTGGDRETYRLAGAYECSLGRGGRAEVTIPPARGCTSRRERAGGGACRGDGPGQVPYRDKKGRLRLLETEPIRITVQSNLGERPREARLKPIRDIFPSVPWWRRNGAWIAGALALCALLLGVWFRYRRRPAGPKGEPVVPAHLTALGQLDALEREGLFDQGLVKAHYFRLSEILRRYIESLRTFPAAECTTEEIASRVEAPEDRELVKLLRRTDLVKFADRVPDAAEKEADLDLARSYVKQTAPADEAEPAPERPVRGGGAG